VSDPDKLLLYSFKDEAEPLEKLYTEKVKVDFDPDKVNLFLVSIV